MVNEFVRKNRNTGCSHRTLNSYGRTLKEFSHEQFPNLTSPEVTVRRVEDDVISLDQRAPSQNTKRLHEAPIPRIASGVLRPDDATAGVMERGEDRFHKQFTPHVYRTVFPC